MKDNRFMAWCPRRRELSSIFELGSYPVWETDHGQPYWGDPNWIIMQFMWLQDKAKVDIFEGAVIAVYEEQVAGCFLPEPKETHRDVATMERFPGFWLRGEEEIVMPKNTLVLGNVYQNPELLEVSTN